ncbi:hypothetical protein BGZ98_010334 [Dissophora globulifera]|nr:hypothetical protein BGZ98_010334 [Dissophora globulifera]
MTSAAATPTGPPVANNGTCINSSTCAENFVCGFASANVTVGTCILSPIVCPMSPILTCLTSADCPTEFSLCAKSNDQFVCTGLGTPGTADECKQDSSSNGGLMSTVKYAGIAVGCVAALGLAFALVRWQRRRKRSGMPAEMFGEIDYGMTNRRSAPSVAKPVENYPFSSRPNAHGSDHAPPPAHDYGGYDNNQYYEEPIGYNNNKMHQDQYYGHDQYDNQYYGNHKEPGYGYDQQRGGGGGGGGGDGFYDNAGYDDYGHQGGHGAPHGHLSPVTSPSAVAKPVSPRHQNFDNYGPEPSEMDYGDHGYGHGHGGGQGGGHGGRY